MMTREDVLRELELLPVWSLRTPPDSLSPLATVAVASLTAISPAEQLTALVVPPAAVIAAHMTETAAVHSLAVTPKPTQLLQHMLNDSGDCMFVFASAELQADEATLLRNMVMAMAMKTKLIATPADISECVVTLKPKLVIALGEVTAQYLLQTTLPLADLRGSVHNYQGLALVASYDLAHLLQNLPDKTHAWADLCLALNTLQSLKSAD